MLELSANCPLKDAKNSKLALEWAIQPPSSNPEEVPEGLSLTDMDLASRCRFYRTIGLCSMAEQVVIE